MIQAMLKKGKPKRKTIGRHNRPPESCQTRSSRKEGDRKQAHTATEASDYKGSAHNRERSRSNDNNETTMTRTT